MRSRLHVSRARAPTSWHIAHMIGARTDTFRDICQSHIICVSLFLQVGCFPHTYICGLTPENFVPLSVELTTTGHWPQYPTVVSSPAQARLCLLVG